MKFSLLPILLIIVLFGAVYSDHCMMPTIVRGQVFVDGNLLPNGTIEICVSQSCNNISISDGTYSYAPTINDSGSNITLKIYDENNKSLAEKTFFIGCGESKENFDIYVNTSNQISSSSGNATINETSETNNNVNTINQNNPPQTQPPTSNTQQNSNPSPLHPMPNSPPSTASDTSLNTSPNGTSTSGSRSYNFSATNNGSINDRINNTNRSQETINISEYNVSNTSNNSASSINFDSTTMYLLIVVVFLFIILIFLWKRSNKTT